VAIFRMSLLRRLLHLAPLSLVASLALGGGATACSSDVDATSGSGGDGGAAAATATGPSTSSSAAGPGPSTGAGAKPLAVATWNVLNLIDGEKNSSVPFEDVDPNYAAHRAEIATVIDTLRPDVFMLQEVESQAVLDSLNGVLDKKFAYTKLIDGNDPRGIDVAILSDYPFDKVVSHKSDKFLKKGTSSSTYNYSRDCLEVHMTVNGRHVVMLGVHFKSKDSDDPDKRLAEAQHTRIIANGLAQADPTAAILILGDFNDAPGTATMQAIMDGTPPFLEVADAVPENDRWTYKFGGKVFLIDHIMANPLAHDMLDPTTVSIPHTKAVTNASDHAPIRATFLVD
jgi:predicted extracellular nuclease